MTFCDHYHLLITYSWNILKHREEYHLKGWKDSWWKRKVRANLHGGARTHISMVIYCESIAPPKSSKSAKIVNQKVSQETDCFSTSFRRTHQKEYAHIFPLPLLTRKGLNEFTCDTSSTMSACVLLISRLNLNLRLVEGPQATDR